MNRISGDHGVLLCPACGDDNVHIDQVLIDGRVDEDGDHIGLIADMYGVVRYTELPEGFQGDRNQAITITGWCEQHPSRIAYTFLQRKGKTYINSVPSSQKDVEEP